MDINQLRDEYKNKFGKRPFPGWSAEEIQEKLKEVEHINLQEPKTSEDVEPPVAEIEKPEEKKIAKEPTITLTKDQLKHMLDEIRQEERAAAMDLRSSEDWKEVEAQKKIQTARMKLYQKDGNAPKGVIIDWKKLKDEWDEETRKYDKMICEIVVRYDGGETEKVNMPLIQFARISDYETVKILETEAKKMVKVVGKVRRALPDRYGYVRSSFAGAGGSLDGVLLGDFVDERVERIESKHKIQRPNGETFWLRNDRLNA